MKALATTRTSFAEAEDDVVRASAWMSHAVCGGHDDGLIWLLLDTSHRTPIYRLGDTYPVVGCLHLCFSPILFCHTQPASRIPMFLTWRYSSSSTASPSQFLTMSGLEHCGHEVKPYYFQACIEGWPLAPLQGYMLPGNWREAPPAARRPKRLGPGLEPAQRAPSPPPSPRASTRFFLVRSLQPRWTCTCPASIPMRKLLGLVSAVARCESSWRIIIFACSNCLLGVCNMCEILKGASCQPGLLFFFFLNFGLASCQECVVSSYVSTERQTVCDMRPGGFRPHGEGCRMQQCLGGSGTPDKFEVCPPGASSPSGATACTNCLLGMFNDYEILECACCQLGFFGDGVGLTICQRCAVGSKSSTEKQAPCDRCLEGSTLVSQDEGSQQCSPGPFRRSSINTCSSGDT